MTPKPRATAKLDAAQVVAKAAEVGTVSDLARAFGINVQTFRSYLEREKLTDDVVRALGVALQQDPEDAPGLHENEDGTATIVSAAQTDPPWTPEQLMEKHGLKPDEWEVVSHVVNAWNAMTSDKATGDNRIVTMHQLKVRVIPRRLLISVPDPSDWKPPAKPRRKPGKAERTLVVCSDHHAPHHDRTLHKLFCRWLADEQPDEGIIAGDLLDFHTISRYREREGFAQPVNEGLKAAFHLLLDYRHASPDTRWILLRGNHDSRLEHQIVDNVRDLHKIAAADEEIPALSLRRLLHLDELGIEYVEDDWDRAKVRVNKRLTVRHGVSTAKNASKVVLDRLSHSTIQGHTHRASLSFRTEHDDEGTTTRLAAESGCMAEIAEGLGYTIDPNWQQGCLLVHAWGDDFLVTPLIYVPGRLLAPGKRYTS